MARSCGALDADPQHPDAYFEGVGQDLPRPDAWAEVVVLSRALHRVPRAAMVVARREAHRVLRTAGVLYVVELLAEGPGHKIVGLSMTRRRSAPTPKRRWTGRRHWASI